MGFLLFSDDGDYFANPSNPSFGSAKAEADPLEHERRRVLSHVEFLALPEDCELEIDEANIYFEFED